MHFNNIKDNKRWTVYNAQQLSEKLNTDKIWYEDIKSINNENTIVKPGLDNLLNRAVVIKTTKNKNEDNLNNSLIHQIDLLNEIGTHLLPEPLDYFNIGSMSILVLDYQPGHNLKKEISLLEMSGRDKSAILPMIARIARNILYFMQAIEQKNYIHLGLCPEHIIMINNQNVRVVGLDKIYKYKNNKIKIEDIKNRYIREYMPPEVYEKNSNNELDAKAIAAFSLGIILCQMICIKSNIEEFMTTKVDEVNTVFSYPNSDKEKQRLFENLINQKVIYKKRKEVKKLIYDLCNPNPKKRLKDFKLIEERLNSIGQNGIGKKTIRRTKDVK